MSFDDQKCTYCGSGSVRRIPRFSSVRISTTSKQTQRPGKIVDEFIKETTKEIKREKKKLSEEEF